MKIFPYLNFDGHAEAAFNFYRSVFGGEFVGGIQYITDALGMEEIPQDVKNRVMHVCLQINPDLKIMAAIRCVPWAISTKPETTITSLWTWTLWTKPNAFIRDFPKVARLKWNFRKPSGVLISPALWISLESDG